MEMAQLFWVTRIVNHGQPGYTGSNDDTADTEIVGLDPLPFLPVECRLKKMNR
jgi:hypothetical protein